MRLTVYGIPFIAAFLANFTAGAVVYSKDTRSTTGRLFALMMLCFSVWNLSEAAYLNSESADRALVFVRLTLSAVCFLGPLLLHLSLIFPREHRLRVCAAPLAVVYVPAAALLGLVWFGRSVIGPPVTVFWARHYFSYGPGFAVFAAFQALTISAGLYLIYRCWRRAPSGRVRFQAGWVCAAAAVPAAGGILTNAAIPLAGVYVYPLAGILTVILSLAVAYAIVNRSITPVTPATAAETILSLLPCMVILLDPDMRILYVNKAFLDLCRYREDDVIGKPVGSILYGSERRFGLPWSRMEGNESFAVTFSDSDGRPVPIAFSGTMVSGPDSSIAGFAGIGHPSPPPRIAPSDRPRMFFHNQ